MIHIRTIATYLLQLLKLLSKSIALLIPILVIYQLLRLSFYLVNSEEFPAVSFLEYLELSFYGLRFDFAAISMLNLLFFLFLWMPGKWISNVYYIKFTAILFVALNSFGALLALIDHGYFKLSHRRLTFDFIQVVKHDLSFSNVLSYCVNYWYLLILLIALVFVFYRFASKKITHMMLERNASFSFISVLLVFLVVPVFLVIGVRGGTQMRPMTIANAADYTSSEKTAIVLNTVFTFFNSSTTEELKVVDYLAPAEAEKYFTPIHFLNHNQPFSKQNVVVVILESFGKEYVGYFNGNKKATPFLDSLMQQGIVFTNGFANATRSIEGVPAILASIPHNNHTAFIASPYSSNQITSMASLLKSQGYQTSFYHGGRNGTMSFDSFTHLAGVDSYFGLNEYPDKLDFDGHWGIWDEPYLKYYSSELNSMKQPFFSTVFTLSSHDPYQIPATYQSRFPEGEQPINKTIAYTDFALQQFFEEVKKQAWFKNTLFVFTADHSTWTPNPIFQNSYGNLKIPILMYAEGMAPRRIPTITQQIDILPTVMDYLHFDQSYFSLGKSTLRDTATTDVGFNFMNSQYQVFNKKQLIKFDGEKVTAVFDLTRDSLLQFNLIKTVQPNNFLVNYAKSYLQQYTHALVDNKMTIENYFRLGAK